MPLSGALALDSQDTAWSLPCRRLQIWRDSALRVSARGPGWWIALCGPADRWAPHLPAARQDLFPELFPGESQCPNELRRLLVRLAQIARVRRDEDAGPVLAALCHALVDSQRDLQRRLQRCSGRTQRRRQQTLLRLLRVRQQIERHDDGRLDLTRLARIANYSPCHLIRMHREVFDENALRIRRAAAFRPRLAAGARNAHAGVRDYRGARIRKPERVLPRLQACVWGDHHPGARAGRGADGATCPCDIPARYSRSMSREIKPLWEGLQPRRVAAGIRRG